MKVFIIPLLAISLSIFLLVASPLKPVGGFGLLVGVLFFIDTAYLYRDRKKDRW